MFKTKYLLLLVSIFISIQTHAGYFGPTFAVGVPYAGQTAITYATESSFSIDFRNSSSEITSGTAKVKLEKPEVNLKWHPFSGYFYIGVALGEMTLSGEATDESTGEKAEVEVTANTVTPNIGWLWGKHNGGLVFGMEFGFQSPQDSKSEITSTTLSEGDEAYDDAKKQADDLGEAGFPVITFFKIGYLF